MKNIQMYHSHRESVSEWLKTAKKWIYLPIHRRENKNISSKRGNKLKNAYQYGQE